MHILNTHQNITWYSSVLSHCGKGPEIINLEKGRSIWLSLSEVILRGSCSCCSQPMMTTQSISMGAHTKEACSLQGARKHKQRHRPGSNTLSKVNHQKTQLFVVEPHTQTLLKGGIDWEPGLDYGVFGGRGTFKFQDAASTDTHSYTVHECSQF